MHRPRSVKILPVTMAEMCSPVYRRAASTSPRGKVGVRAKPLCLPDALRKLAAQDERRPRRGVDDGRNGKRIVHSDQYARV